ncbi:MAG: MBL fold metallo-hydrolase, partial [Chloroflexota bacterium]
MFFEQILDERNGCASYVIASRESNEAAIVDPGVNTEPYAVLLRDRGFHLRFVIDTHIHGDHVSGARRLAGAFGAALCLYETAKVAYAFRGLRDGEELALGELRLRVAHTPGHRPELISILVTDPPHSPEPSMVLTGDSLLVGDVGRPDFGGGDAAAQFESLSRLLRLPDWVAVFPGHFEGPCGKSMFGQPSTTIGYERLYNPLARLEREPFITSLTESLPARPLNLATIEATNLGKADMPWAMLTSSPPVHDIGIEELEGRPSTALLLDVREPDEFAQGHVPGATSLPQFALAAGINDLPRDSEILVICRGGSRSRRATQFLMQCGFTNVLNVARGTEGWRAAAKPLDFGDEHRVLDRMSGSAWMPAVSLAALTSGSPIP